jgi:hypothetical protein
MKHQRLLSETLIAFDQHKELPGKPTYAQLNAWRSVGMISRHGGVKRRVYLEMVKIGGRPHTSLEAYMRFEDLINE